MSKLLYVEPTDEITDLVDRIRRAEGERDLAFVLPPGSRVLRSPLDAQLLMQYTRGFQKRVAIVSGDPQIQALAIRTGFPTFTSLSQLEQGLGLTAAPVVDPGSAVPRASAAVAAAVPAALAGSVVAERGLARRPPSAMVAATAGGGAGRVGRSWWHSPRTRAAVAAGGGVIFLLGVLAVLVLLPTATVLVGVQAHRLTDNVTVQGSVGSQTANVLDVISTQALATPTESQSFTISPSGTQVLPPTAATGDLLFCYTESLPPPEYLSFNVSSSSGSPEFVEGSVTFTTTTASEAASWQVYPCGNGTSQQGQPVPVQASSNSLGSQGNVAAAQSWTWPQANANNTECLGPTPGTCLYDKNQDAPTLQIVNPQAMTGGQNSKTQTIFTSSDVASAQQQEQSLAATLTTKAEQDLKAQAGSNVIAQDSSGNGVQITVNDPTLPTVGEAGSAKDLTVSVTAAATAYNPGAARAAVLADLKSKVPNDGELLANPKVGPIQVLAAGPGGTVTLTATAVGYWAPRVDLSPYRSKITLMSPGAARTYLLSQLPGASTVVVHQSPFDLPWLPLLSSRIHIVRQSISGSASTA